MQQIDGRLQSPVFPEMYKDPVVKGNQEPDQYGCIASYLHIICPCFYVLKKEHIQGRELRSIPEPSQSPSILPIGKATIFTMAEIIKATSNFSISYKVGEGGFGTVYKGKLKDGTFAAIKRARKDSFGTLTEQFRNEVNMLASIEHLNLVRLIGYVEAGNERILVEEFVANHNLREHLDCKFGVVLDFCQRVDIAIDIAHALTYLHLYADKPVIHRDVKSSNIMLTEKFRAKVADFGFSREGPMESGATHVMTKVKGTAGYLDPEYVKTYQLTPKSDVYAFGILLVEIFSGRRPIEHHRSLDERITVRWAYDNFIHSDLAKIVDPRLELERSDAVYNLLQKIFELAFRCSAPTRQDRPSMKQAGEVLWSIRRGYQRLSQSDT